MKPGSLATGAAREGTSARRSGSRRQWLVTGLVLVALLVATRLVDFPRRLEPVLNWVAGLGAWAPAIFVALYVLATVLMVPGSVLTLGAGAVFGVLRGTLLVSIASTLAATAAFLIGRYLVRDAVARRLEGHEGMVAIDRAVAAEGWKIVLLTRLSPVFPFTLLNYAYGMTRVKLGQYVLASWLGMLPGTVMYVYLGSLAGAAVRGPRQRTPAEWALYALGLAATVTLTVVIARIARKALARRAAAPGVVPENRLPS